MKAYSAALRHLGSRARTCRELEQFLKKKEFKAEEIENTIEELKAHGYLNDANYCEEYFRYAEGKGKGFRRIKRELLEKGVDSEVIDIAWEDYEPELSERELAEKQAHKIIAGASEINDKLLAKVGRRLSALGYSTDLIYQIIGQYMRDRNE